MGLGRVFVVSLLLAACGRIGFDDVGGDAGPGGTPHSQTLAITSNSDDGDINNTVFNVDGEGTRKLDYVGYWTASTNAVWSFYRFRLAEAIPPGALITSNTRLRLWGADGADVGANANEFALVAAELAASTTLPTATADIPLGQAVFLDSLGSDWSLQGSNPNFATVITSPVRSGTNALRVDITANGGYFTPTTDRPLQLGDFAALSFDINVGPTASTSLDAIRLTQGTPPSAVIADYGAGGHFAADTWYHIVVPASDFRSAASTSFDIRDATNDQISFFLDNIRLEQATPSYRMTTLAMAQWQNAGATAYVDQAWNTSSSLAPVLQDLVDAQSGLAQGSYVTLWVTGPRGGVGYTNEATYMPGFVDYALDPARAAQLTIEYR